MNLGTNGGDDLVNDQDDREGYSEVSWKRRSRVEGMVWT